MPDLQRAGTDWEDLVIANDHHASVSKPGVRSRLADERARALRIGAAGRPALLIAVLGACLGGCGMSSLTNGFGGSLFGSSSSASKVETGGVSNDALLTAAKADKPDMAAGVADIAGGCPRFTVWSRDGQVTIYEPGRVGDALGVMQRGEITKTARECRQEGDRITIKYGFSGKVLLGPRGKGGNVQLPLTVFVTDAKRERVTQDAVRIDVPVALDKPIGYFSAVREVTFQVPEGSRPGEFEVFVGFDRNIPNAG